MKQLYLIALSALCGVYSPAQGIVWSWVPNTLDPAFVHPIGIQVYNYPDHPLVSVPISMTGNGTVDFQFQATTLGGAPIIQVLPSAGNAVLSTQGGDAVLLTNGNQVSSINPVGVWVGTNKLWPSVGPDLLWGEYDYGYGGQFINQIGYVGVEFYAADGLHYGALDVGGEAYGSVVGWLYGYGYNPVPNQPFDLSLVPPVPAPLAAPQIVRPGNLRLNWESVPGQGYQVQFKNQMDAPCWSNFDLTIIATDTSTLVDIPMVGAAGFYQVIQVQ